MLNIITESRKETKLLKFGIDRLLSTSATPEEKKLEKDLSNMLPTIISYNGISKPTPTIAVPCSDCVSSLYRCCKVSTTGCIQTELPGYIGSHLFGSAPSTYTIQPIRPFATRPSKFLIHKENIYLLLTNHT